MQATFSPMNLFSIIVVHLLNSGMPATTTIITTTTTR